jgi:putrescine transport system ATP-binding protein
MPSLGSIRRSFAPWEDPGAKPYISFQNVTKRFGTFTAVDNLSLDVYEREFFSLLGPSGCGKTTLLRMLAGFETPTGAHRCSTGSRHHRASRPPPAGQHDVPVLRPVPAHERGRNVAYRAQAGRNGKAGGRSAGRGDAQAGQARAASPARKPHQLSGGQRQRVALARALVAKRPKLLLLDEPLGALDKKLREETQFELMDLQQELGVTFMIVTHDQEEAMTMSDRIG